MDAELGYGMSNFSISTNTDYSFTYLDMGFLLFPFFVF